VSCRSQCCIAESLWGVYSAIARRKKITRSSYTENDTEQPSKSSTDSDDYSGHLTAASLTIRHFLCAAHLDAAYALLLKVMRAFDCRLAPSKLIPPAGSTAAEDWAGDSGYRGGVCLEALLCALPLSALTARCREVCDSKRRSDRPADADPGQRNAPSGRSTDDVASSSGLILTLLESLLGDVCALLSAEESGNSKAVCNGIQGSAYGTAIGLTLLTAASASGSCTSTSSAVNTHSIDGSRTNLDLSSLSSKARASVSVPRSLLRRIGAISKYLLGVSSRARDPKGPPAKACEVRKMRGLINAQRALVIALETSLSSSQWSSAPALLTVPKSQNHSQSQPTGRQHVSPYSRSNLSHPEVRALESSALSMLAACEYLSVGPITFQMFSAVNSLLAARPPSVTSTALRAVKSVCQTLGLILSFAEAVTGETFEFAKKCFHSMIKVTSAFSQTLQSCESNLSSPHYPPRKGAVTPVTSALPARMDVAVMWSTILSFLVKFAKGLPPSLQSGAQSLVPQKVGADGHHDRATIRYLHFSTTVHSHP
jgi:hypothetical protein